MRLLNRMRHIVQTLHYSYRTEQAYVDRVRRFVLFNGKRHPLQLGAREVGEFLTHLAVVRQAGWTIRNDGATILRSEVG